MRAPLLVAMLAAASISVACTGSGGTASPRSGAPAPAPAVTGRPTPDLAAFLAMPVATPTACPSGQRGSSAGRSSPWVGTVDVSVFVDPAAGAAAARHLGATLRAEPQVATVYTESRAQARQEFARLYTCSSGIPAAQLPASYRLRLTTAATVEDRNALVAHLVRLPAVDSVSCDPSAPCVDVVRSASPTATASP